MQTLAELLMGYVLATLQGGFAALYCLNKADFFFKIPGEDFLGQFVRIAALLRR